MGRGINASATLFNYYRDPDTRQEQWRPVYLEAVHWENRKGANVIASGLSSADALFLMVWLDVDAEGREYVRPKKYARLAPDEVGSYWTMTEGADRIVKGKIGDGSIITDLKQITNHYDDCLTITTVDTIDFGPRREWHIEAGGK